MLGRVSLAPPAFFAAALTAPLPSRPSPVASAEGSILCVRPLRSASVALDCFYSVFDLPVRGCREVAAASAGSPRRSGKEGWSGGAVPPRCA